MKKLFMIFVVFSLVQHIYAAQPDIIFGKPFSDGSPACVSCHSVIAAGYTVKTWGPDISGLGEIFGDDAQGLADFIKNSGIPAMDAVYMNSGIEPEELTELIQAYTELAPSEEKPSGKEVIFYAAAVLGVMMITARSVFRRNRLLEADL